MLQLNRKKWPKISSSTLPLEGIYVENVKKIRLSDTYLPLIPQAPTPSPRSADVSPINLQKNTRRPSPDRIHGTSLGVP